ncbi:endonuclease/exonuclease/phosphatase family protein [Oricola sp.]|uniref:endonuclease/exonuclease/phosphatase family protein n=1 Tax=Oricola sp. TaxID=1979950 RepID=UPI003BAD281D
MTVKVATYNIQFGIGFDGQYDLKRIADAVADADVIALQEVTRGFIRNAGRDMVAEIEELFADRFCAVHMPADVDFGSTVREGKAEQSRFQFGNMIISRWPLISVRRLLLPRSMRLAKLNLQRGALEAMIDTPAGVIRFYSVHLDHIDAEERHSQIDALKAVALAAPHTGLAATGLSEYGFPELPVTEDLLLLGDFNFEPDLSEYRAMLSEGGHLVDVTAADSGWSWTLPEDRSQIKRLDYGFANPELAERVTNVRIDQDAEGSDHMPVWIEIGA